MKSMNIDTLKDLLNDINEKGNILYATPKSGHWRAAIEDAIHTIAELQEKLSKRNLQIDYLKKRIAKKQMLEAKARQDIKSCYALNKKGEEYLPNDKIDDHRFYMDKSHRLVCEQNELLMALLVAEGKMDSEKALEQ